LIGLLLIHSIGASTYIRNPSKEKADTLSELSITERRAQEGLQIEFGFGVFPFKWEFDLGIFLKCIETSFSFAFGFGPNTNISGEDQENEVNQEQQD